MQIGVCAPLEKAALLADAGADYIELNCSQWLMPDASEQEWARARQAILAMPLPVDAFNIFIAQGSIIGPHADPVRLKNYAATAARRAADVGASVIVVGSGRARNIPDGMTGEQASSQFLRFLESCAKAATQHGIIYCIEPLNRTESNFINSIPTAVELARSISSPGVRILADSYHMEMETEPLSVLLQTEGMLKHAHTADSSRLPPGRGVYKHAEFFKLLRLAGYNSRVSIESRWDDFDTEVGPAISHLRQALA
jgi:sugar phosphate isomerase/epimerase